MRIGKVLDNWQFNHKLTSPSTHIPTLKDRNVEVQPKLTFKNIYFIYFMKWKKLRSPTRTTLTNSNFQFSFCELGKN